MNTLFVTGAGTDIGKTYVACALLQAWRGQGVQCDALKPVASGYDPAGGHGDPERLLSALGRAVTQETLERLAPLRFAAPVAPPLAARAEGRDITLAAVNDLCRARMREAEGVLLIEGAGGVMSPLTEDATCLDLIETLGAPVLFVSGSYLGAVSHALTGLDALRTRGATVAALVVSESLDSAGLEQTCAMLRRYGPALPVFAAPRGDDAVWATDLARALR